MMTERKYWYSIRRELEIAAALDAMVAKAGGPVRMPAGPAEPGYRSEAERARNAEYKRRSKARERARMALEASTEAAEPLT